MRPGVSIIFFLLITIVISMGRPAWATVITVEVEGVVNSTGTGGDFSMDGSVSIGSTMVGYCMYDTDTPEIGVGGYALISISMSVGNYTFTHNPLSPDPALFIVHTVDPGYWVRSDEPRFNGTIYVDGLPKTYDDIDWLGYHLELMELLTSQEGYITTSELPDVDSFPDFSIFDWRKEFGVGFTESGEVGSRGYFGIDGEITSLTVVPEPATIGLLALGAVFLRRRRR